MTISPVTLEDMLRAREDRAREQQRLGSLYGPILCFTMNIPGPVKDSPLIRRGFFEGVERVRAALPLRYEKIEVARTGCTGWFAAGLAAAEMKKRCIRIEEKDPLGRLFDLDVLDETGEKLSRGAPRPCLLCGGPAPDCARSRAHGLEAVREEAERRLMAFAREFTAQSAYNALLEELNTTPKPGLVDRANCGAHRDMDHALFEKSAAALLPWFRDAFRLGAAGEEMSALKARGREAEREMFAATGGINTHKGLVYSLGLLCAAEGLRMVRGGETEALAAKLAARDAEGPEGTHGAEARRRYGAGGAKAEAAAGFPHAVRALGRLRDYTLRHGPNTARALTLNDLMCSLEDTNLLYRGGEEGLAFVRREAEKIKALPEGQRLNAMEELDRALIRRGLSPGGSADALAVALFLDKIKMRSCYRA